MLGKSNKNRGEGEVIEEASSEPAPEVTLAAAEKPKPKIGISHVAVDQGPVEPQTEKAFVQAAELAAQLEAALASGVGSGESGAVSDAEQLKDIQVEDVGDPEKKVERREVTAANTHRPWRSGVTSEATARLGRLPWRPSMDHTTNTLARGKFAGDAFLISAIAGALIWGATFVLSPLWLAPAIPAVLLVAFSAIVLRYFKNFK